MAGKRNKNGENVAVADRSEQPENPTGTNEAENPATATPPPPAVVSEGNGETWPDAAYATVEEGKRAKAPSGVTYALVGFTKSDAVPDVLAIDKTRGRITKTAEGMAFALRRNYASWEIWQCRKVA